MPIPIEHALTGLLEVGRPLVVAAAGPRCCIAAARVTIEVLAYFGHPSRPVATQVLVCNEADASAAFAPGLDASERVRLRAVGAGLDRVGFDPVARAYDGHLVVACAGDLFVDIALAQFARPQWGIDATATTFRSSDLAAGRAAQVGVGRARVMYQPTGDTTFRQARAWKTSAPLRRIVGDTIRSITAGAHRVDANSQGGASLQMSSRS